MFKNIENIINNVENITDNIKYSKDKSTINIRFQFLLEEYKIFKDLFIDTERTIQVGFQYYTILVTTIFGGIAFLFTHSTKDDFNTDTKYFIILLFLTLVVILGFVYTFFIAWRYGNLGRYGRNMDEIRLCMLRICFDSKGNSFPYPYDGFNVRKINELASHKLICGRLLELISPGGAYQFVISIINSFSIVSIICTLCLLNDSLLKIKIIQELFCLFRSLPSLAEIGVLIILFFIIFLVCNIPSSISRNNLFEKGIVLDVHR